MNTRRTRMGIHGGDGRTVARSSPVDAGRAAGAVSAQQDGQVNPWTTRSPLTNTFPTAFWLNTSIGQLPAPPPGFSAAGQMALFPLINITAKDMNEQDVLLTAVHAVLGSTDNSAPSQGRGQWGQANGLGAGIIVAEYIPGLREATGLANSWSVGTVPLGWIDTTLQPRVMQSTRQVFASPFAPGNFSSAPSRIDPAEDDPPHVVRITRQQRIQAAFVLNATQAATAVGNQLPLNCLIELRLRIGRTFTLQSLGNT